MCQTDPLDLEPYKKQHFFNSHNIQERQKSFKTYYATMNDVFIVANSNPGVNFRYIMTATEELPGSSIPIFVKPTDLQRTYDIGYNDAISAINHNSTAYERFADLVDDYEYFTLREGFD